tara:strand:- start:61 stop:351 length:291 start_codon:yes stop_codon:yes gene_type:complete
LATKNSELLGKLANNYPNFYKKDLKKLIEIFLNEIKSSLKRHERVELRDIFTLETKLQKSKYARNPKTNEKIFVSEKYSVVFKTSKFWNKKVNEEK